jgi:hypothetical protein
MASMAGRPLSAACSSTTPSGKQLRNESPDRKEREREREITKDHQKIRKSKKEREREREIDFEKCRNASR